MGFVAVLGRFAWEDKSWGEWGVRMGALSFLFWLMLSFYGVMVDESILPMLTLCSAEGSTCCGTQSLSVPPLDPQVLPSAAPMEIFMMKHAN
jgi:hypothetical protein